MDRQEYHAFLEAKEKEENRIIAALLETQEGRLFCALLIEESGFLKNAFRNAPEEMAFAEGERSIGGRVFEMILRHGKNGEALNCMSEYRDWLLQMQEEAKTTVKERGVLGKWLI